MNTFLKLIISFYNIVFNSLNMEVLAVNTQSWIEGFVMGPNSFMTVILLMGLLNLFHRPKKYKFNLFLAPRWAQILMRQVLFFNMIVNPVLFIGSIILLFALVMIKFFYFSRFSTDEVARNPFSAFFS